MRQLSEIIESCEYGEEITLDEAMYSICIMNTLMTMNTISLVKMRESSDSFNQMRIDECYKRWQNALKADPSKYISKMDDPKDPENVKRKKTVRSHFNEKS